MIRSAPLALVLLLAAPGAGFSDVAHARELSIVVSPNVSPEPGWVDLRIRVQPDAEDRALIVEVDSQDFFRSSLISLAGDDSPLTHWLRFEGLPAGEYFSRASVERSDGERVTAASQFTVAGAGGGRF